MALLHADKDSPSEAPPKASLRSRSDWKVSPGVIAVLFVNLWSFWVALPLWVAPPMMEGQPYPWPLTAWFLALCPFLPLALGLAAALRSPNATSAPAWLLLVVTPGSLAAASGLLTQTQWKPSFGPNLLGAAAVWAYAWACLRYLERLDNPGTQIVPHKYEPLSATSPFVLHRSHATAWLFGAAAALIGIAAPNCAAENSLPSDQHWALLAATAGCVIAVLISGPLLLTALGKASPRNIRRPWMPFLITASLGGTAYLTLIVLRSTY